MTTIAPPDASERRAVFEAALELARAELAPLTAHIDSEDEFPTAFWQRLGEIGYLGAAVPEEYGGSGGDYVDAALICEAIARVSPAVALSYGAHLNLCVHNILRNGTPDQRARLLPALCSGERIGAMALTEPDAGSDAMGIRCVASPDPERPGWHSISGRKMFITNAPIADVFVVYAKTTPDAGSRGITAFVVESPAPGLAHEGKIDKVGMRGSPTGEVALDGVSVGPDAVLGEVDAGYRVVMSGLDLERAFLSVLGVAVAEECLELSIAYARQREQFGRPIGSYQLVQAKLADMYTGLHLSRLATYDAIERFQRGERISRDAAAAVLFASEHGLRCAEEAVQIHGGYGYTTEFPVQRYWRDAKLGTIGAGTSEIRRLLIARELLGER
jgi:isovaleryl-CoA dehydrogenase